MTGTEAFFDRNVERWRLYSESVKGRLRHELAWYHLQQNLGSFKEPMRVLDAGCGLSDMTFELIDKVEKLVLLDFSEKMIDEAKRRLEARNSAIEQARVTFVHAPVEDLTTRLYKDSFDLIVCHNTLEYVEKPMAVLASLVKRLVPGGILSLIVANRFSEPLKLALVKFDLPGARLSLHAVKSTADLFDHAPKRTFSFDELDRMAGGLGLKVAARYGIRIFADYLPEAVIKDPENYQVLFELEKEAASQLPLIYIARYLQMFFQNADLR